MKKKIFTLTICLLISVGFAYSQTAKNYSMGLKSGSESPVIDLVIDGDNSEWAEVPVFAEHEGQVLKIFHTEEYVALMFDGLDFSVHQFYFDVDENTATGYRGHGGGNLGAEYRIESGTLTRYTGDGSNWSWESLGSVSRAQQNGVFEVKLDRSYFTESSMLVFFKSLDADRKLIVSLPRTVEGSLYEFVPEWLDVPVFAEDEGQTLQIYHNEEVVALRFDGDDSKYYAFYFDEDQDASTGYTGHGVGDFGADYRVENGTLYKHTGPGWVWENLGSAAATKREGVVELKLDRNYFTNSGMLVFFRTIDADWNPVMTIPASTESYLYQFTDLPTNISESSQVNLNSDALLLYPNPAVDFVYVVVDEGVNSQQFIQIFSTNGQLVLSKAINSNYLNGTVKLDLSVLAAGVYSIVVKTDDTYKTGKIVKQ